MIQKEGMRKCNQKELQSFLHMHKVPVQQRIIKAPDGPYIEYSEIPEIEDITEKIIAIQTLGDDPQYQILRHRLWQAPVFELRREVERLDYENEALKRHFKHQNTAILTQAETIRQLERKLK